MKSFNSITLIGHSGIGKTALSQILAANGWFHYSGDYRIAKAYLKETIQDWLEDIAKEHYVLNDLLAHNALKIGGKVEIDRLYAISAYVGKLGKQGLDYTTFTRRQRIFAEAEKKAMYDVARFQEIAQNHWGYRAFINDAGGSLGEYIEDEDLMKFLSERTMMVHIRADEDLLEELVARAVKFPKPICYDQHFLDVMIRSYCELMDISNSEDVDCDDFIRFVAPKLLVHRNKRYELLARRYGVSINAREIWKLKTADEFTTLLQEAWYEQQEK